MEGEKSGGGGGSNSPRAFLPATKRRNSKGKTLSQDEVAKLSPLTPIAPSGAAPNVVLDSPSPRAGRNQKQKIPTLKLSSTPLRLKEAPSEPFKHLLYEERNFIPHKALGMSVSMDGDIFVPRPVRDAWSSIEGIEGTGDTGRDVRVDKVTAVRINEEYERAQARKDREEDIYYKYYCKETAKKIEEGRDKVERAWSKVRSERRASVGARSERQGLEQGGKRQVVPYEQLLLLRRAKRRCCINNSSFVSRFDAA